jgi:hypothetical protein
MNGPGTDAIDPPRTDIGVPISRHGIEIVTDGNGSSRVIRHFVLANAETRTTPARGGQTYTEWRSWDGRWVMAGRGCGNSVTCDECRRFSRERVSAHLRKAS